MAGGCLRRRASEDDGEHVFPAIERVAVSADIRERPGDEPQHAAGGVGTVFLTERRELVDLDACQSVPSGQAPERLVEGETHGETSHVVEVDGA